MPQSDNVYDLPFRWKKGEYKINKKKLENKLNSKIYYGNIQSTIDEFVKINPKNIISIFFDMDYYSSTKNFLNQIYKLEQFFCPRVYCYFDNIFNINHWINEHLGENLAIKEFNRKNKNIKIGLALDNINDFKFPLGKNHLLMLHNFNHQDYKKYIGIADNSLELDDNAFKIKIF